MTPRNGKGRRSGSPGQRREGDVLGGASPTAQSVKQWLTSPEFGRAFDFNPVPGTIEVKADPQVSGTFAAQFTCAQEREPRTVQLLFVTGLEEGSLSEVLEATLEEVEYESWPPKSGSLRFF